MSKILLSMKFRKWVSCFKDSGTMFWTVTIEAFWIILLTVFVKAHLKGHFKAQHLKGADIYSNILRNSMPVLSKVTGIDLMSEQFLNID